MQAMKSILAPAMLAIMLGSGMPGAMAHDHDHSHEKSAPQKLMLKNGHKWDTDEALRQAMSRIRTEMAASQPGNQGEKVSLQQYQAMANKVNEQVAFMMQNCKLDKDADAMLHLVLADIIAGVDAMAGQNWGDARQGAKKVKHALENYATYFNHPGW
jgi:hypothetical protein